CYHYLIFTMPTKMSVVVSKDTIARFEITDIPANGFYFSGKLAAKYLRPWFEQAAEETYNEIVCAAESAIRPVYSGCVYLSQYFAGPDRRKSCFLQPHYLRGSVLGIYHCL